MSLLTFPLQSQDILSMQRAPASADPSASLASLDVPRSSPFSSRLSAPDFASPPRTVQTTPHANGLGVLPRWPSPFTGSQFGNQQRLGVQGDLQRSGPSTSEYSSGASVLQAGGVGVSTGKARQSILAVPQCCRRVG